MLDVCSEVSQDVVAKLQSNDAVIKVRVINK